MKLSQLVDKLIALQNTFKYDPTVCVPSVADSDTDEPVFEVTCGNKIGEDHISVYLWGKMPKNKITTSKYNIDYVSDPTDISYSVNSCIEAISDLDKRIQKHENNIKELTDKLITLDDKIKSIGTTAIAAFNNQSLRGY